MVARSSAGSRAASGGACSFDAKISRSDRQHIGREGGLLEDFRGRAGSIRPAGLHGAHRLQFAVQRAEDAAARFDQGKLDPLQPLGGVGRQSRPMAWERDSTHGSDSSRRGIMRLNLQ